VLRVDVSGSGGRGGDVDQSTDGCRYHEPSRNNADIIVYVQ